MAGSFSPELLGEIRSRVDMVELVGQFVKLKRAGENWKGLCPFHAEKTPSFTVHPRRGIFHCFGCGVGGDAFGFLMRQDRLSFPEAVRLLAERTGVPLPAERRSESEGQLDALREAMRLAAEFYREQLWGAAGERARAYLLERGVDQEAARRFGLGYAPEGWDTLLGFMRGRGMGEDTLTRAGLVLPRQTGPGCYDRFRGRLLFPIRDLQGRTVAFGGRALGRDEPKYLNSPETPLYVKGQTLYAMDLAREGMRARGRGLVVEGYLDCLQAHQHGFGETVAALGTAFTPAQLALLRRHADEVVVLFDADAAGQRAAARLEEMLGDAVDVQELGWAAARAGGSEAPDLFSLKVAVLPPGHDPDSLLRAEGPEALQRCLDGARSIFAFILARALGEEDRSTARGRATAHARAALVISRVHSPAEASALAAEAARALGVDATQLWIEAQQLRGARARRPRREPERAPTPAASGPPPGLSERDLLALLLHSEAARAALLPCLDQDDIAHPGVQHLVRLLQERPASPPEALLAELPGDGERGLLASLLVEDRQWEDLQGQIEDLKKRYDIRRRKRRIREVSLAIAEAQAAGDPALPRLEAELRSLEHQARAVRELSLTRPAPGRGGRWA